MTPLLLLGATSVAKYLASRAEAHAPALPVAGNVSKDFSAVLRAAVGPKSGSVSPEADARVYERELSKRPELKAALATLPVGAVVSIQVAQNGDVSLVGPGGAMSVAIGSETRDLARQAFVVGSSVSGGGAFLTPEGVSAISVPFRVAKGV